MIFSVISVSALSVSVVIPAQASELNSDEEVSVSAIESISPESLESVASTTSTVGNATVYQSDLYSVEVPRSAEEDSILTWLRWRVADLVSFLGTGV